MNALATLPVMLAATLVANGFEIHCPREGDAVAVDSSSNQVVFTVTSARGIGSATIARQGPPWPAAMILRLKLSGLESLTIQAGNRTLKASALSHNDYARRVQLVQGENKTETLDSGLLRAFTADGRPTDKLPGKDGWFELTLPRQLMGDDVREMKVDWIDFYR